MWGPLAAGLIIGWGFGYPFGKKMQRAIEQVAAARRIVSSPFGPVQAGLITPTPRPDNVVPFHRKGTHGAA